MLGSKELKVYHQTRTSLCWWEGNKVVDENRNHRGARMVLPIMNSIEFLEELIRLMMITTQLSRDFMQMQSISDDIKPKE